MNKIFKVLVGVSPLALPAIALAQQNDIGVVPGGPDAFSLLGTISNIFSILIPILITLAVVWVIWGVIKYATAGDDETQASARKTIISGVIALFVIVSLWGLVAILNTTFGVGQGGSNVGACQPVYDPVQDDFVTPPGC